MVQIDTLGVSWMLWVQLGKPAPHLFYWRIPIPGVPGLVYFRKALCTDVARSDTLAHYL